MKTTVNAVLINLNCEEESMIRHLQTLFSSAVRFSYQRLLEGQEKKDIQKKIQERYGLNSRYASDAIEQARQLKLSQKELLDIQIENWQNKVKRVQKQIKKAKSPEKLPKAVKEILPKKIKESNKHHWPQWYIVNKTILKLRKAGVKPAFSVA